MEPGERRAFSLPSRLDRLGPFRATMRQLAAEHGWDSTTAEDFALCVHEAASNAIVHGNREAESEPVEVVVRATDDGLQVTVSNGGPGFDPRQLDPDADAGEQPRGRGMRIICSLADAVTWADQGRRISFVKRGA